MIPDISEIGGFAYDWDFDEDSYNEYLEENELQNSEEVFDEYIRDNVGFNIELLDSDTFHTFDREYMYLDDIENEFGEKLANIILSDCKKDGEGRCESYILFEEDEVDINNPKSLNDAAKKVLKHGNYYKDCRGFILSDGTVVYTPLEHNQCSAINGVSGTFQFIKLGNIRVLQQSIDVGKKPTEEQVNTLRQVISCYSNSELYLDIFDGSEISAKYVNPSWRKVIADIMRYYDEGIKPMGNNFYEENKRKRIVIKESKFRQLFELSTNTYQSAANQAFDNEDDNRVRDFRKAAEKEFTDNSDFNSYKNDEKWINLNNGKKLVIFDKQYKNLNDLYNGVKQGKLLIHARGMVGEPTEDMRYIDPCFSDTLKEFYGGDYEDWYNSKKEYYGDDFDEEEHEKYPELIFASDNFSWCHDKRNGIFFIESEGFQKSLGEGMIQLPNGTICNYYEGDVYDYDSDFFKEEPICCEYGDWYSNKYATVVAVMNIN